MSNTPDIIVPLTSNPSGPQAWIWIDVASIDRGGDKAIPNVDGLEDKWRISLVSRASLAMNGVLQYDLNGNEIPVSVPNGYGSLSIDIVDILHDERIAPLLGQIRQVFLDILTRTLKGN